MKKINIVKKIKENLTKIISILISAGIIIYIYFKIDLPELIKIFKECNILLLIISLLLFIPATLMTSMRFRQLIPSEIKVKFIDCIGLILSASTMNIFLPSKMGDIAKFYFMKNNYDLDGSSALSIVIFEKTCDLLSLLFFCLIGLIIYPLKNQLFWPFISVVSLGLILGLFLLLSNKFAKSFFTILQKITPNKFKDKMRNMNSSWLKIQKSFLSNKIRLSGIAINSIFIWFLHLFQFWFFILALKSFVPFLYNLALASLSILAGLLPLTFAGIGTRDAAIIYFYSPFFNQEIGAALGILATSRYLIPAVIGIPFLSKYLLNIKIRKNPV